ncbi:putative RNA 2'-phosphotransferase [Clarias magur]|uniref:Putative RNA 2'-phosphotransferase n=1 Tax=Clarias magur TaxID=1594786 RepID=A0A8J4X7D2_CLAMG|nr:putative RNA 2'-phosphotransferase [Clarias magur]
MMINVLASLLCERSVEGLSFFIRGNGIWRLKQDVPLLALTVNQPSPLLPSPPPAPQQYQCERSRGNNAFSVVYL